ncbi:hypothetical protein HMPREF3015_08865 [Bacteroides sp. HMSC073E02]|nr:hypothetical protein HMPREF3015_08865 [Bacteroides sp. HMSC073E02]
MNAMTGTFATQFLSEPDGVVHGRQHGTAVQLYATSGDKAIRGFCSQRRKEFTKCSIDRAKTL